MQPQADRAAHHHHGLRARRRRRFRVTTDSQHLHPVAPNVLARRFAARAPDTAWVTDITYVWTQEGWLYLAVILDLCSRAVVGWALSARMTRQLPLQALTMALGRRRPPRGLLHHSDRGSQYASADYQRVLAANGIVVSMSRRGDCWHNAVAESFFATLKVELAHEAQWPTRAHAQDDVFEYLEGFYNGRRRHSALGYLSPVAFEHQWQKALSRFPGASAEMTNSTAASGSTIERGAAISVLPEIISLTRSAASSGMLHAPVITHTQVDASCPLQPRNRGVHQIGASPVCAAAASWPRR